MKKIFHTLRAYIPFPLIIILVLGAYLRLYRISEYMTFLGDEGRDMLVILHMIRDHKWTLLGPTASVGGFFLGPVYYYFMLPFVWISGLNPAGAAVMVALFGIAAIYMLYRFAADVFDDTTGYIAAGLFAVSPLVIAYSRSSWNPNVVPFFAVSLMYVLWKTISGNRPNLLFVAGIILGIGLQLHYLFLFLFAVAGVILLVYGRKQTFLRGYALGVAGFLIGYGPFLAFELRHGFPNTISIFRYLTTGSDTGFVASEFIRTVTDVLYRLFGRLLYRLPPPEQWVNLSGRVKWVWDTGVKFTIWSSVTLAALWLWKTIGLPGKKPGVKRTGMVLLSVWLLVPLMLFGLYKKGIYDYYFGIFFAVPFLFAALLLRLMMHGVVGRVVAWAGVLLLVYFNWLGRPFAFVPNNQLAQAERIAKAAYEKTDGKPYNFALISGGNSDHAYRYFFEKWGNAPVTIENEAVDPERDTVTDQLIVICESSECKPLGNSLWEVAGFGRAEIIGHWQESFVTIYKLGHYQGPEEP